MARERNVGVADLVKDIIRPAEPIKRKTKRSARNKTMRDGIVFRADRFDTKRSLADKKAANRKRDKAARASRKRNRRG
jgi:hypothetical protein